MSDNIQISLSVDRVVLEPGGKTEVIATVQNSGSVVEVFSLAIKGIDSNWYSLSVSSVSLFPGDKEQIRINFSPPLKSASKAGSYQATVAVSSKRDPTISSSADLTLDIGSVASYQLDLSPQKAKGRKGAFQVLVTNTGNVANTYKIEAADEKDECTFDIVSDTVVVEAGTTKEVALTVNPRKKPLTGDPKTSSFTVKVSPYGEGTEIKTIDGQMECPARLPKWAPYAIAGAAVAFVVLIVLIIVLSSGGGGALNETKEYSFDLAPGHFRMVEIHQSDQVLIEADATWVGEGKVSLVLYAPDGAVAAVVAATDVSRHEAVSPLEIMHQITTEDVADGDTWKIYAANLDSEKKASDISLVVTLRP